MALEYFKERGIVFEVVLDEGGAVIDPPLGGMNCGKCAMVAVHEAGRYKLNCTAVASFRSVDREDMEKDLAALRKTAEKYGVEIEVDQSSEYHDPADMSRPAFAYTKECIARVFPEYPAAPFILPAGTDARTLTEICSCVLRFAPIRLSAQQLASVHSENENIDLAAVVDAVAFYRDFLAHYR